MELKSNLIMGRCPCCGVSAPNLTQVTYFTSTTFDGHNTRYWAIYLCKHCGGAVTAYSYVNQGDVQAYYPKNQEVNEVLPDKVKSFLKQALETVHAPSASIMVCASAVDAMLKEKGYKTGSLYKRIEQAQKDTVLTKEMSHWAHDIRLDANDERHADDNVGLPTPEDAKKCIEFALTLSEFLFVLPARVTRGLEQAKT